MQLRRVARTWWDRHDQQAAAAAAHEAAAVERHNQQLGEVQGQGGTTRRALASSTADLSAQLQSGFQAVEAGQLSLGQMVAASSQMAAASLAAVQEQSTLSRNQGELCMAMARQMLQPQPQPPVLPPAACPPVSVPSQSSTPPAAAEPASGAGTPTQQ